MHAQAHVRPVYTVYSLAAEMWTEYVKSFLEKMP